MSVGNLFDIDCRVARQVMFPVPLSGILGGTGTMTTVKSISYTIIQIMNIIFFGSDPWFSPPVLEALLKAGHEVPIVVTKGEAFKDFRIQNPDLRFMEVKTEEDISVEEMVQFNHFNHSFIPDAIVLASFGPPFLPAEVLKWPKYGCLNVHASLLPRWRGASPVFGAIAAGDKETGVSIMKMIEEIDRGPVLGQAKTIIRSDTRETLTRRLGILGGKLIVEKLKKIENGQLNEVKRPQKSPTPYTHRFTKDSGRIDWEKSPVEIERFIRAVTPWPGAWTEFKDKGRKTKDERRRLKILKVHLDFLQPSAFSLQPSLVIDEVQLPGKNPVAWKQFLAGHPNTKLE